MPDFLAVAHSQLRLECNCYRPAESVDDFSKRVLSARVNRVVKDELTVIALRVINVTVLGDELNTVDSDVHSEAWLAIPVEVGRLRHVRHVVDGLQIASVVQVFDHHVARWPLHLGHSCTLHQQYATLVPLPFISHVYILNCYHHHHHHHHHRALYSNTAVKATQHAFKIKKRKKTCKMKAPL